jgi:hypothetical protein
LNDDPQKQPLPEFTKAPSRLEELTIAIFKFILVVLRICIKLVLVCFAFLIAFLGAIAWRK